MDSLQAIIKDKTEDHSSLLEAHQQAQRDLAERNEEIDKLAGRIRELEQALLNSVESVRTVGELEQELHKAKLKEQELMQVRAANSPPAQLLPTNVDLFFRVECAPLLNDKKITNFKFLYQCKSEPCVMHLYLDSQSR